MEKLKCHTALGKFFEEIKEESTFKRCYSEEMIMMTD